jgi:hypothetical protein
MYELLFCAYDANLLLTNTYNIRRTEALLVAGGEFRV